MPVMRGRTHGGGAHRTDKRYSELHCDLRLPNILLNETRCVDVYFVAVRPLSSGGLSYELEQCSPLFSPPNKSLTVRLETMEIS